MTLQTDETRFEIESLCRALPGPPARHGDTAVGDAEIAL